MEIGGAINRKTAERRQGRRRRDEPAGNVDGKYLVGLGVPAGEVSTISFGKEKPLDPGHSEEAWMKNRRDHFDMM